jgi:hypothetical protein
MGMFKSFPEQLELVMERTDALPSYAEGYNTGVNWDASWMPGGPWTYEGRKLPGLRDQSKRNYEAWHEGFKRGLKLRMENPYFAAWWEENRRKGGLHRYYAPEVLNENFA